MGRAHVAAAQSFQQTLEDLGLTEQELGNPSELGRRAALLAAAEGFWSTRLGPLLNREQVQGLLGVGSRQAVSQLVKRGRLLALPTRDDRFAFPAFQFSPNGRPYESIAAILSAFEPAQLSSYTIASWFVTPKRLLRGATPAQWLRRGGDPDRALEAARRTASRLAH